MVRLVLSLLFAMLLLIFTSKNMHPMRLDTVFGPPVELPVVLALLGAFIVGFALATFRHIVRESKRSRDRLDGDF
ncbi:MAG: hypothetical protein H7836_03225 [Magnetococcus sp. YQC-3]